MPATEPLTIDCEGSHAPDGHQAGDDDGHQGCIPLLNDSRALFLLHVFGALVGLVNIILVQLVFWKFDVYVIFWPEKQFVNLAEEAWRNSGAIKYLLFILGWIGPTWEASRQLIRFIAPILKSRTRAQRTGANYGFTQPVYYILCLWNAILPLLSQVKLFLLIFQASFLEASGYHLMETSTGYTLFCWFVLLSLLLEILLKGMPVKPAASCCSFANAFVENLAMEPEKLAERIERVPGGGRERAVAVNRGISIFFFAALPWAYSKIFFRSMVTLCLKLPGNAGTVNQFRFATIFEDLCCMLQNANLFIGLLLLVLFIGPFILVGLPMLLVFIAPSGEGLDSRRVVLVVAWCKRRKFVRVVLGALEEIFGGMTFLAMWTSTLLWAWILAQIADGVTAKIGVKLFKDGLMFPVIRLNAAMAMLFLKFLERKQRTFEQSPRSGNILERWGSLTWKVMVELFLMGVPLGLLSFMFFCSTVHGETMAMYPIKTILLIPINLVSQMAATKAWVVLTLAIALLSIFLLEFLAQEEQCRAYEEDEEAIARSQWRHRLSRCVDLLRATSVPGTAIDYTKGMVRCGKILLVPVILVSFFVYWRVCGTNVAKELKRHHYITIMEAPQTYEGKVHPLFHVGTLPSLSILMGRLMGRSVEKSLADTTLGYFSYRSYYLNFNGLAIMLDPDAINNLTQERAQPDVCEYLRVVTALSNATRMWNIPKRFMVWNHTLTLCTKFADNYFGIKNPTRPSLPEQWEKVFTWSCPYAKTKDAKIIITCLAFLGEVMTRSPQDVDEQQVGNERYQDLQIFRDNLDLEQIWRRSGNLSMHSSAL